MPSTQRGVPAPYLRAWRLYHAMTQEELAKAADVSHATVRSGEHGENIRQSSARKMAAALGISVQQLLHMDPANQPPIGGTAAR
jgi:transcriptional regulator with XRE-family HTH domain